MVYFCCRPASAIDPLWETVKSVRVLRQIYFANMEVDWVPGVAHPLKSSTYGRYVASIDGLSGCQGGVMFVGHNPPSQIELKMQCLLRGIRMIMVQY
jgi:hypothetical protein